MLWVIGLVRDSYGLAKNSYRLLKLSSLSVELAQT